MSTRRDITIEQYATFVMDEFVLRDSDGDPVNLNSYTAEFSIRRTPGSDTELLNATSEAGEIVLGGSSGTINMTLLPADTALLPAGSWRYDLVVTSPASVKTRALEGMAIVSPGIVKP